MKFNKKRVVAATIISFAALAAVFVGSDLRETTPVVVKTGTATADGSEAVKDASRTPDSSAEKPEKPEKTCSYIEATLGMCKKICIETVCFESEERKKRYEKDHKCEFPPELCKGMDKEKQCCGKDPQSGEPKAIDKVADKFDPKFDAAAYTKSCPDKKQSEAPPNAIYQTCEVGKPQIIDGEVDEYNVVEVLDKPPARRQCIDGCSTPAWVMKMGKGESDNPWFLTLDKDNPSGHKDGGFGSACRTHDICYQTCGSTKEDCDLEMLKTMLNACDKIPGDAKTVYTYFAVEDGIKSERVTELKTRKFCRIPAEKYYKGMEFKWFAGTVKSGAYKAFNQRQQQFCQCC